MLQDKEKIWRMAEIEIERLKKKLRQQKDRDDRLRGQVRRRLKQKIEDFDRLYREHKSAKADNKS